MLSLVQQPTELTTTTAAERLTTRLAAIYDDCRGKLESLGEAGITKPKDVLLFTRGVPTHRTASDAHGTRHTVATVLSS